MTAAGSMTARSSRDRSSRRDGEQRLHRGRHLDLGEVARGHPGLALAGGSGPCRRASTRAATTNSGLPSAEPMIRVADRRVDGAAEQHLHEPARVLARQRRHRDLGRALGAEPHSGRFSSSPRRPVATTSSDACLLVLSSRCSSRSRNVSSPLWASSMITTTGRRIASASRYLRAAQKISVTGNALVDRPMTEASRSRISCLAGDAVDRRAELGQRALGRVVVDDAGRGPRPSRSSGQNVMPSPYGRQRPRRTVVALRRARPGTSRRGATCRRPRRPGRSRSGSRRAPRPRAGRPAAPDLLRRARPAATPGRRARDRAPRRAPRSAGRRARARTCP